MKDPSDDLFWVLILVFVLILALDVAASLFSG